MLLEGSLRSHPQPYCFYMSNGVYSDQERKKHLALHGQDFKVDGRSFLAMRYSLAAGEY